MSSKFILTLVFSTLLIHTSKSQSYRYQKWMEDWSAANAATYGVSIDSLTIFDIVLPGAHQAGMSFTSSDTTSLSSNPIFDSYGNTLNSLDTIKQKQSWAARQKGSVYQLLMSGVRFLDLKFQHDNETDQFYAYNGLLGRTVTEIISNINDFLTNIGTKEIILIYLHDFLYSQYDSIANEDALKQELMDIFATNIDIKDKIAREGTDNINQRTIKQLIETDNINIIIFSDDVNPGNTYPNTNYFYDANTYLFIPTDNGQAINNTNSTYSNSNSNVTSSTYGQLDEAIELRSFVINNIRYGWPDQTLNLIYWALDIGSSFTEQFIYNSMQQFSSSANTELTSVLSTYDKLWFANIIIVDFIETSDIMEQILILNYKYSLCKDARWGNNITACPYLTRLESKYFTSDISSFCNINTYLQTNSWCPRSCGTCPSQIPSERNPGDACTIDTDCNGIIYSFYGETGQCFIRPSDERSQDNIAQQSFCLSLNAQTSCANKEVKEKCSTDNNAVGIDITSCTDYCTSNWQCVDGYCNTEYSVCMTLLESSTTTKAPVANNGQRYHFITSEGAEIMLRDVAPFRPGDYQAPPDFTAAGCDSPGAGCLLSGMDANPYLASLLGFAIIPFIMSLVLCFCYTFCCCPCWCCCDRCGKRCCCCHKIMKDPREDGDKCRQWTPFAFLAAALVIVVWACIEGIVNNSEMHDHIFDENNSVKYAVNHLFNEVIDRFEAVEPTAEYIVDFGIEIINDVFNILERNTGSVSGVMDKLYASLSMVERNYSNGVNITATFVNPFDLNGTLPIDDFTIVCPNCDSIADNAATMKDQLNSSIGSQLGQIDSLINQTKQLVDAKDTIKNLTEVLFETLNEVINMSNNIQKTANKYIDMGAKYDTKYREQPAAIFFLIPLGLIIFVIAGVFMKNKWCFKCEWFCAMYCCGIPIMLLSWPFIFFAVLWGDLCVRLDDFEQNLGQSQIGKLAQLDRVNSTNDPRALGMALVNTCWHGGSPLDLFNLTQNLNWDDLRSELDGMLDVDITAMLEDTDINQYQTEVDALSVDEFVGEVDGYIANANNLGSYCGCGAANRPFTRANLYTPPAFSYCATYENVNQNNSTFTIGNESSYVYTTLYWYNTSINDGGKCREAFVNASAAVQIQTRLHDEASRKIAGIKGLYSDGVFDTYDELYAIALNLENDISSISCLIEPLFQQFDIIMENFTNCGFLGEAYGNFKEAGCVNLFDDWYKIARAMALIAYISILIVFCALCMDYIYGPVTKRLVTEVDDEIQAADQSEFAGDTPHAQQYETNTVELVSPGGTNYQQKMNYDDAAPSDRFRAQSAMSIASYSGTGNSLRQQQQVVVVSPMHGVHNKPVVAESEVQTYAIAYDNEPAAAQQPQLQVIQQGNEDEEPLNEEGGGATNETGNNNNYDEPVVPQMDDMNSSDPIMNDNYNNYNDNEQAAVVISDEVDVVLKDSSDED